MSSTRVDPDPAVRRRRHRRKLLVVEKKQEQGGTAVAENTNADMRRRRRRRSVVATATETETSVPPVKVVEASPRLWVLLREAQEEMDRGTDVLGDELHKLWRSVHGGVEHVDGRREARGDSSTAKSEEEVAGRRRKEEVAHFDGRSNRVAVSVAKRGHLCQLPKEKADALLDGLGRLQREMEAETHSFHQHKVELVRRLTSLGQHGGGGEWRDWDGGEVVQLEEEAESMRAAVIASHARLLGRVRELQDLPRKRESAPIATTASTSAATTASFNATGVQKASVSDSAAVTALERNSSHSLDDLVDSAKAVVDAREELIRLTDAVEAVQEELARESERTQNAQKQTSRLEALRTSMTEAASRAHHDTTKAHAKAEAATRALQNARDGLATAQAARHKAEDAVESERRRLESLRRETERLAYSLRGAAREVNERKACAEAAATAAEQEEARLADCRDSFGLEVEGLQKGVGELESEAAGWREALEQTQSRVAAEEKRGQKTKRRIEAEKARLEDAIEGLKAEAEGWESRAKASHRRHESDQDTFSRETQESIIELQGLKDKVANARLKLGVGKAELQAVASEFGEKVTKIDAMEATAASLERRVARLEAHVGDLEAERSRASQEGDAGRRRQAKELSRWKEAMVERREEFERLSELVESKAASLGDLERQTEVAAAQARQSQEEQNTAEARAEAALRTAHEVANLAERGSDKAEREKTRAAEAESRTAKAVEKFNRVAADLYSESSCLGNVQADLDAARQECTEAQAETARARKHLQALAEKRREDEGNIAVARQRAAALAREEAELRITAIAARQEVGGGREAVNVARSELAELQETVDKERRVLEGFRDKAVVLEAEIARRKEEDRFARESTSAQQARLDEIKREVVLQRDERLRVEKNVWALKSELEILSTKRDDAAQRDRRRDREEGALNARREALAVAAAREEERLSLAATKKKTIEAEVTDLEARAGTHTAELSSVTQEAAALREDASVAARRSDEARRHLAALQKETAQLSSQTEAMRASKRSLTSELAGLRHELATLREGVTKRGQGGDARLDISTGTVTAGVGLQDSESLFPYARRSHQEAFRRVGDDDGGVAYSRKAIGGAFERPSSRGHVDDARVVESSSEGGNLVEIVADFQGRLRRQVQAALAEGSLSAGCKQTADRSPFTRGAVELNLEDSKTAENRTTFLKADQKDGVFSGRGGGRRDVLGELEKRVGSV